MKLKRIFSFFLMLVMLLTMFPTAYATGEVTNGEVPTEGVQSTETQQMESEPTEGQDEYAVSPLAVADKYHMMKCSSSQLKRPWTDLAFSESRR